MMGMLSRISQDGFDLAGVRLLYPTSDLMKMTEGDATGRNAKTTPLLDKSRQLEVLNNIGKVIISADHNSSEMTFNDLDILVRPFQENQTQTIGSFTWMKTDSVTDSKLRIPDLMANLHCTESVHVAQTQTQIPHTLFLRKTGIRVRTRTRIRLWQCKLATTGVRSRESCTQG